MTARRWALQAMRLHNSLPTGQDGGTLYAIVAMAISQASQYVNMSPQQEQEEEQDEKEHGIGSWYKKTQLNSIV